MLEGFDFFLMTRSRQTHKIELERFPQDVFRRRSHHRARSLPHRCENTPTSQAGGGRESGQEGSDSIGADVGFVPASFWSGRSAQYFRGNAHHLDAIVWAWRHLFAYGEEHGVTVLGTPMGHPIFVRSRLAAVSEKTRPVALADLGCLRCPMCLDLAALLRCSPAELHFAGGASGSDCKVRGP